MNIFNESAVIFKTILRSPLGVLLVMFQLSLSIALISNAMLVIEPRWEKLNRSVGVHDNTYFVRIVPRDKRSDLNAIVRRDIAKIRRDSRVMSASSSYGIPLWGEDGLSSSYRTFSHAEDSSNSLNGQNVVRANYFGMDEFGLSTLGLNLIAGRGFSDGDVYDGPLNEPKGGRVVIITQQLARALFGEQNPIGLSFYESEAYPLTVIGVVEHLIVSPEGEHSGNTILLADAKPKLFRYYLIRLNEGVKGQVVNEILGHDADRRSGFIVREPVSFKEQKKHIYRDDLGLLTFMLSMCLILLVLCAFSVSSLMTYLCEKRRTTHGILMALGGTSNYVFKRILLEVIILVLLSSILGGVISVFLNSILIEVFVMEYLPFMSVILACFFVVVVSLFATIYPASKAAKIKPADIIRSH